MCVSDLPFRSKVHAASAARKRETLILTLILTLGVLRSANAARKRATLGKRNAANAALRRATLIFLIPYIARVPVRSALRVRLGRYPKWPARSVCMLTKIATPPPEERRYFRLISQLIGQVRPDFAGRSDFAANCVAIFPDSRFRGKVRRDFARFA